MQRVIRPFCFTVIVVLSSALAFAQSKNWESATVLKADFSGTQTEVTMAPLPGGGAVGESSTSSGKHSRGRYWLTTGKYTYVIPNYCKANLIGIQLWLYLTVGGQTKISPDSSRTLRVIDDDGKERKVHIIERILNQSEKQPQ